MTAGALAPLPAVLPLGAAAALAAVNRVVPRRAADAIALLAAAASGACSARLMALARSGLLVAWFGGWLPRSGAAVGICFAVDPFGAGLALLAAVLTVAALVFSLRYFDSCGALFHVLLLCFLGAMSGFSLTGDVFDLFVFFELMSAAAFALCGYKIEAQAPVHGALNFGVTNTIGAFLALTGIGLLYGRTGALNMAQLGRALAGRPDALVGAAFGLIAAGFLVKAAAFPFHFWLDDAHAVAPTPVCILLSGVMVELGVYAVARVYWTALCGAFAGREAEARLFLTAVGAATAVLGALMCFSQRHIKRLLAYSTVSHVGVLLCALGLLDARALAGGALYLLGHGLAKAALFIAAGMLLHAHGTVDELELHGRGRPFQAASGLFLAGALALAGLPPFPTFGGHSFLEESAGAAGAGWLEPVFWFSAVVTAGAVARLWAGVFLGLGRAGQGLVPGGRRVEEGRETRPGGSQPLEMTAAAWLLLAAAVVLGCLPSVSRGAAEAAARFVDASAYQSAVLEGGAGPLPAPAPQPRHEGRRAAAASLAAAAAVGLGLWSRSRFWPRGSALERAAAVPMRFLHELHSGRVGDYAAFLTFGAAAFAGAFVWIAR